MRSKALALVALLAALGCGSEVKNDGSSGAGGSGGASASVGATAAVTGGAQVSSSSAAPTGAGSGGAPGFAACSEPGSCILAQKDCCGPCGRPALEDFDAVAVSAEDEHFAAVCPDPGGTPCPGCASTLNPDLFAYCDGAAGACVGVDLPATDLASCATPSDCALRAGADCCTACGDLPPEAWVALRADALDDLASLVCAEDAACPECEPGTPPGLVADCVEGVCIATVLRAQEGRAR